MYIKDLSILGEESPVIAIGWLDDEHPFPKSSASEEFLDALFEACIIQVRRTRGFHVCPFCSSPIVGPIPIERKGKRIFLGTAQIRIESASQKVFGAPTLIYHYVSAHDYEPPKEFVEAVLAPKRND